MTLTRRCDGAAILGRSGSLLLLYERGTKSTIFLNRLHWFGAQTHFFLQVIFSLSLLIVKYKCSLMAQLQPIRGQDQSPLPQASRLLLASAFSPRTCLLSCPWALNIHLLILTDERAAIELIKGINTEWWHENNIFWILYHTAGW